MMEADEFDSGLVLDALENQTHPQAQKSKTFYRVNWPKLPESVHVSRLLRILAVAWRATGDLIGFSWTSSQNRRYRLLNM
jgi:hypothetical protein